LKAGTKGPEEALAAIRMARTKNELVSDKAVTQWSPLPCNGLPPGNRKTAAHRARGSVQLAQRGGEPLYRHRPQQDNDNSLTNA